MPIDKLLHFAAGLVIAGTDYYSLKQMGVNDEYARAHAIVLVSTLAIGKEVHDQHWAGGKFDPADAAVTMGGGVIITVRF